MVVVDYEYEYLRDIAYIEAEKQHIENQLIREEFEHKPAKIELKYVNIIRKMGAVDKKRLFSGYALLSPINKRGL